MLQQRPAGHRAAPPPPIKILQPQMQPRGGCDACLARSASPAPLYFMVTAPHPPELVNNFARLQTQVALWEARS